MSLLGIDVGTSGCKAVVFDRSGGALAEAAKTYASRSPGPGRAEMDAGVFWDALVQTIREASAAVADDPVEALAISSQGETFVAVDGKGRAVAPAIMNSDSRAVRESELSEAELGKERIYELTGLPPHPMYSLNKIVWLREHEPEVFRRASKFLTVGDYLLTRMGLPPVVDFSLASRTMAFDIGKRRWAEELLALGGLRESSFAAPMSSGSTAGTVDRETASLLGVRQGTVVAVGGHDQPCGALGAGVIGQGDVADSAGSYECLTVASERPRNTPAALSYSLNTYCHVVPERYVTLAFFPAGFVTSWFVEELAGEDRRAAAEEGQDLYRYLEERLEKECPGPTGVCVTPHFIGSFNPSWDVRATGSVIGLTPSATRLHLYKAVHEGMACELAINVGVLEEVAGAFEEIRIYGGVAGSPFSVQLRADLSGKRFRTLTTSQAVCRGAAMLAGIATGAYRDCVEAVDVMVHFDRLYEPNVEAARSYAAQFHRYRLIHPSLAPVRAAGSG